MPQRGYDSVPEGHVQAKTNKADAAPSMGRHPTGARFQHGSGPALSFSELLQLTARSCPAPVIRHPASADILLPGIPGTQPAGSFRTWSAIVRTHMLSQSCAQPSSVTGPALSVFSGLT